MRPRKDESGGLRRNAGMSLVLWLPMRGATTLRYFS